MRGIVVLVSIFIASVQIAHAQQGQWVIEIVVSGSPTGCQWTTAAGSFSSSFNSVSGGATNRVVMSSGDFTGTINGSGSYTCNCIMGNGQPASGCTSFTGSGSGSVAVTHTASQGEGCVTGGQSFSNSTFSLYIGYTIYKTMDQPTVNAATGGCGTATLTSPSSAASYAWQVTDDTSIPGHWNWIVGKNTQVITVGPSDLNFSGFTGPNRYVRVTANECDRRFSMNSNSFVVYLPGPTSADIDWGSISCFGGDGSVKINSVTGAVNNYTYTLKFKDGSGTFGNIYQAGKANTLLPLTIDKTVTQPPGTPMKAGEYLLDIANNVNTSTLGTCSSQYTHTITQPTEIAPSITPSNFHGFTNKCKGDNSGELSVSATGGTPGSGYTYSWSTGSVSDAISGLVAGTYTVTVKDANQCTKDASISLTEPTMLSASVAVVKTPSCDNSADGQLSVAVSSGTGVAPYTYSWTNGSTSTAAINLLKGNHSVTITDDNGCQLAVPKNLAGPDPIIVTLDKTSPTCAGRPDGGKVWVSNVQNIPGSPAQYLWNTNDASDQLINVPAGNYSVVVSSVNNGFTCTGTAQTTLVDPIPWTAEIVPLQQYHGATISCSDAEDGQLNAVVKNNLGQVVNGEFYSWTAHASGATKNFIDELGEGDYEVKVKYNGICEATDTYSLRAPLPVNVVISPDTDYHGQVISCFNEHDGAITVTASDGTGSPSAFTYSWVHGPSGTSLTGLGAGVYTVKVYDVNSCMGTNDITIANPDEVTADIPTFSNYTGFGVSCKGSADGFLTAEAGGGTAVYSYSWSNGEHTAHINSLLPDNYTITVSDNNGCSANASRIITEPDLLTLQVADKKEISCFNGSDGTITLSGQGGAPQYQYSIDNTVWQDDPGFNALPIGAYVFNIHDANGCSNTVAQDLTQPTKLNILFTDIEPAFCADPRGRVKSVVTGGVGNYQYEWKNSGEPPVLSTTDLLANVPAGIYSLDVLDGNNCPAYSALAITSTDGAKTSFTSKKATCFDSSDGSAVVNVTEGEGPFIIKWPDNQNTPEAVNLKGGTYNVLITDVRNCTVVQTVKVGAPDALELSVADQKIPTCNGLCDGSITLEARGGVGNYIYNWNGTSGARQNNLCASVYTVVLTDGNKCVLNKEIELKQPDPVTLALVKETLPTCNNGCDGALEVIASGGNGNYKYVWASGGVINSKSSICPALYEVTATDAKGCKGEGTFTLHNTPKPAFDLGGGVTLCVGQKYKLDAGSQWKSVTWAGSNGLSASTQSIVVSQDGTYWADVVNEKGCVAQDTFLLQTSRDLLKAEFFMTNLANTGDTIVVVDVSWPMPDAIEWTFPVAMNKLYDNDGVVFGQFNNPGVYEIALTAHLGECVDDLQKTVTILQETEESTGGRLGYEKFVKTFTLHPNPNDGKFDVSIEFEAESHMVISVWNAVDLKLIGKVVDDGRNTYEKQIDLRPLPSGHYFLRLDHAKGKEYIRFIVD